MSKKQRQLVAGRVYELRILKADETEIVFGKGIYAGKTKHALDNPHFFYVREEDHFKEVKFDRYTLKENSILIIRTHYSTKIPLDSFYKNFTYVKKLRQSKNLERFLEDWFERKGL